jgi:hypothetical protein
VKSIIWVVSLGSSGGVLGPLLMMGGALGGLEAMFRFLEEERRRERLLRIHLPFNARSRRAADLKT